MIGSLPTKNHSQTKKIPWKIKDQKSNTPKL